MLMSGIPSPLQGGFSSVKPLQGNLASLLTWNEAMNSKCSRVASLLLVAMPGAPRSFLFLVEEPLVASLLLVA